MDGFGGELIATARQFDPLRSPFVRGVQEGRYTPTALQPYATYLYAWTKDFQRLLATIVAQCGVRRVRLSLLGNLLEEIGVVRFEAERGIEEDPALNHPTLCRRFAVALGARGEALDAAAPPTSTWMDRALAGGNWLGALAFLTVGCEASVPPTFRALIPGFKRHYGLTDHDLAFFLEHVSGDERHAEEGAAMVAAVARNGAGRSAGLEGARRGAVAWWGFHRAVDRAARHAR